MRLRPCGIEKRSPGGEWGVETASQELRREPGRNPEWRSEAALEDGAHTKVEIWSDAGAPLIPVALPESAAGVAMRPLNPHPEPAAAKEVEIPMCAFLIALGWLLDIPCEAPLISLMSLNRPH